VGKLSRVAVLVIGYALVVLIAALLLPRYGAALFSARWPIILLGPLGFLLDAQYRLAFLQASAARMALWALALFAKTRTMRALTLVGVLAWLAIGLGILSLGY
jgi:hypothetical protein